MAKKNESVLGMSNSDTTGLSNALVPQGSGHILTQEDQRIFKEWAKQNLVMGGTHAQTILANEKISEITFHGFTTFVDTTGAILDIKYENRSKEHQAYVDEFCVLTIQSLARNISRVVTVGSMNIGRVVDISVDPGPEPPKRVSLLERLIG